jgi:hypothetical protein
MASLNKVKVGQTLYQRRKNSVTGEYVVDEITIKNIYSELEKVFVLFKDDCFFMSDSLLHNWSTEKPELKEKSWVWW